jgi:hypothetical protein
MPAEVPTKKHSAEAQFTNSIAFAIDRQPVTIPVAISDTSSTEPLQS